MSNILTTFYMSIWSQLCVTLWWFMHNKTFWHHYLHHIQKWFNLSTMTQLTPLAFLTSTNERYDAVPVVRNSFYSLYWEAVSSTNQHHYRLCLHTPSAIHHALPLCGQNVRQNSETSFSMQNLVLLCWLAPIGCHHRCMIGVHMVFPSS